MEIDSNSDVRERLEKLIYLDEYYANGKRYYQYTYSGQSLSDLTSCAAKQAKIASYRVCDTEHNIPIFSYLFPVS